jgi:hypothetical protein
MRRFHFTEAATLLLNQEIFAAPGHRGKKTEKKQRQDKANAAFLGATLSPSVFRAEPTPRLGASGSGCALLLRF